VRFAAGCKIRMRNGEKLTPQHISEILKGSEEISFTAGSKAEVYSWVQSVLVAQEFASQSRERGSIRAYIEKVTGLSYRRQPGSSDSTARPGWSGYSQRDACAFRENTPTGTSRFWPR
jgi:hypothetical protein